MTGLGTFIILLALGPWTTGQEQVPAPDVRALFESGKHQEVVAAVSGNPAPTAEHLFLAGQAAERLNSRDQARAFYSRLASRPEGDPWKHIGQSGIALLDGNLEAATAEATQATTTGASLPQAHYQLGLVRGHTRAYAPAAEAFQKATQVDPNFAYAHYHAGLSYYRADRIDQMAKHFEAFLKLAPNAPERPEVESIMRTVRGR